MALTKACASAVALLVCTAAAAQAPGGLRPATTEDIIMATRACVSSTGAERVDEAALTRLGWEAATFSAKGKTVSSPLRVYGRKSGNAIIMFAGEGKARNLCTVMARVKRTGDIGRTGAALTGSLGKAPAQSGGSQMTWFAADKIVNMQATGSREKPSVRVSVMAIPKK